MTSTEPTEVAAPAEGDVDVEALIDAAQPAQRSVPLCLRGDLQSAYEELERRLEAAEDTDMGDSLASGSATAGIEAEMAALRDQMRSSTITVVMRALPRKAYRKLMSLHPPKRDDEGKVDPQDATVGFNMDTFFDPLIRACWAKPEISKTRMNLLLDEKISDRQWQRLGRTAWDVNTEDVDVPFSSAGSRSRRPS